MGSDKKGKLLLVCLLLVKSAAGANKKKVVRSLIVVTILLFVLVICQLRLPFSLRRDDDHKQDGTFVPSQPRMAFFVWSDLPELTRYDAIWRNSICGRVTMRCQVVSMWCFVYHEFLADYGAMWWWRKSICGHATMSYQVPTWCYIVSTRYF